MTVAEIGRSSLPVAVQCYKGDGRPVAYTAAHQFLFEDDVEIVGFLVVHGWTAGCKVDRYVVDFSVIAVKGATNDAFDAVTVAEVYREPLADQSLGSLESTVAFLHTGVVRFRLMAAECMRIDYWYGVGWSNGVGAPDAASQEPYLFVVGCRSVLERVRCTVLAGYAVLRDSEAWRFVAAAEQLFESIVFGQGTVISDAPFHLHTVDGVLAPVVLFSRFQFSGPTMPLERVLVVQLVGVPPFLLT